MVAWPLNFNIVCLTVSDNVHQLHVQTTFHVWKTRGFQCSFRLLMMGGVSPETCWASYKYVIIKFWYIVVSCWIFLNCTVMQKILSTPSFGGEVKPSVSCRRFAACKRSLELRGSRILDEICRNISRPRRVPPSAARGLSRRWTWRHLAEKVGTSKGGGKQWQPTPKNLPRMQCSRAIPVAWLCSGSC